VNSLKGIVRFVRPYWWLFMLMVLTVVLPVAMELVVPRSLQYIIDGGIEANDMQVIFQGSAIMLTAAIIGAIATLGQGVCRAWLSQSLAFDMREELFAHIQAFSFGNLDHMQTGQLMTRVSSDVDVVRMFASSGLSLMLRALLMILGSMVMLSLIDLSLTLIVVVLLAIAAVLIWALMRNARPLFLIVQQKLAALNTTVQENLAGVELVKAFVREEHEIAQFTESSVDYMQRNIKVGRLMATALPLLTLLTNLGIVAVIWLGGSDVINGRLTIGELVAFNNYLMIGMAPLLLLGNMLTMVSRADASAERVLEVLDTEPQVRAASSPNVATKPAGHVVFEGVSFHYDGDGGRDVLDDLRFSVEPRQRVALLGATGSGKSTLVNLIPRFYDVTGGALKIDGVDVRDWDIHALRSRVGMVLQQTTLFSGTVCENIAFGRPEAGMEEIVTAAKVAQAHDFIMSMPDRYYSRVEARGANLSGGQRQRLAIARALLIAPTILILDDSTSAVDLETEVKIQEALDQLTVGCTTFIVAQRINSVLNADQIFVLDAGRVSAKGTHAELLKTSPIYQEIYRSQLGDSDLADSSVSNRQDNEKIQ
jgi:ATP-binding cassette subfamily B multidrug efflux pump